MNTLRRLDVEAFLLLLMAATVGLIFVVYRNGFPLKFNVVASLPSVQAPAEVVAPKISEASQISPDGEKKVLMRTTENNDNTAVYEFFTTDGDGTNKQLIFSQTLTSPSNMSVPYNTWSPDDKYFFIQENAGINTKIMVFKATGEAFSETEKYLDPTEIFRKQNTGNNFDEATGWASETLIIINTKKTNGEKGFSYWFEVPSKAIIQLSTDF